MKIKVIGTDGVNWSIDKDRRNIEYFLKMTPDVELVEKRKTADILFFVWYTQVSSENKIFLFWWRKILGRKVVAVVTNNLENYQATKNKIDYWISPNDKISALLQKEKKNYSQIPFYVSPKIFKPLEESKEKLCEKLKIKKELIDNRILIGTFQRDSLGGKLQEPKWQKNPDLLIKILRQLPKEKIRLVLAGPRRHYVISQCQKYDIPFIFVGDYQYIEKAEDDILANNLPEETINWLYNLVDICIVNSKIEGGPKAIIEAALTKTMIFSTDVGWAKEFIHGDLIYDENSTNKIIDWVGDQEQKNKSYYLDYNYQRAVAVFAENNYENIYHKLIDKLTKMKKQNLLASCVHYFNKYPTFLKIKYNIYYFIGRKIRDGLFYLKKIKPGDIAIDCGANIGKYTKVMADRGAEVYAFEPNPYAFKELSNKFIGNDKVHCYNKGVYDKNTTMPLYLHKNAAEDQVKWSIGSSLLAYKSNVDQNNAVETELVDLAEFINNLGRKIKIVKMDIEGAEVEVITELIDTGVIKKIKWLLVEGHGKRIPETRSKIDELRHRIKKEKIKNIYFNWD